MVPFMNKMVALKNLVCPRGCGSFRSGDKEPRCPACGSDKCVPQAEAGESKWWKPIARDRGEIL